MRYQTDEIMKNHISSELWGMFRQHNLCHILHKVKLCLVWVELYSLIVKVFLVIFICEFLILEGD